MLYSLVALVDLISDWKPVQLSLTKEMEQEGVKIYDNYIYYCHNLRSPENGDVRIKYDFAGMCDLANPNYVRSYFLTHGDLYVLFSSFRSVS